MNFKALALAAFTAASGVVAPAMAAAPVATQAEVQNHAQLAQAIMSTGVQFYLNKPECEERGAFGWYWAAQNELVVCQELRDPSRPGVQVSWTEEDLDTLRHEAHHLVQDCRDTYLNGRLNAVYTDPIGLAKAWLGDRRIAGILNAYAEASDHIKVMELEAFSVAAMNDPAEQVRDIQNFCF